MELLAGITVGCWTLLEPDPDPLKLYHWLCRCSCTEAPIGSVRDSSLRSGSSLSCGHLRRDSKTTHGMSGSSIYKSWQWMLDRVKNEPDYKRRGIGVHSRWLVFDNFRADMGPKPEGSAARSTQMRRLLARQAARCRSSVAGQL
jgi:hypothetical protein